MCPEARPGSGYNREMPGAAIPLQDGCPRLIDFCLSYDIVPELFSRGVYEKIEEIFAFPIDIFAPVCYIKTKLLRIILI